MNKYIRIFSFRTYITLFICSFASYPFVFPIESHDKFQDTVIFAWDFHDVLVQKQMSVIAKRMYNLINNSPNRWQLIYKSPSILWDYYQIKKKCVTVEQTFTPLIKKHPVLQQHYDELIHAVNMHKPISESIKLLNSLHNHRFTNILASNIGNHSLELMKKNEPDIFKLFNAEFIPYLDHQTGKLIGKPLIKYFTDLAHFSENKYPNARVIIFIDDRIENIKSAEQANLILEKENSNIQFHAIHFKNATQTKKKLKNFFRKLLTISMITGDINHD